MSFIYGLYEHEYLVLLNSFKRAFKYLFEFMVRQRIKNTSNQTRHHVTSLLFSTAHMNKGDGGMSRSGCTD